MSDLPTTTPNSTQPSPPCTEGLPRVPRPIGKPSPSMGRCNSTPTFPSLQQLCIRTLTRNIDYVEDVGDIPFRLIEPALRICNGAQLQKIESFNPRFQSATNDLLRRNSRPTEVEPGPDENWRQLYENCERERELKLQRATARVRGAYLNLENQRQARKLVVTTASPHLYIKQTRPSNSYGPKKVLSLMEKSRLEARSLCPLAIPPRRAPPPPYSAPAYKPASSTSTPPKPSPPLIQPSPPKTAPKPSTSTSTPSSSFWDDIRSSSPIRPLRGTKVAKRPGGS
ncbi:Elongin-A [Dimargaris cristalligena]|uniref:Elongin-A n=1 Tax=Dimargaris cristalligena TaxID=215637 RepID=A0A4P9ZY69_9FUNG|nr:Elongin-A [Dimargaris cristalligena]RKP37710.1 hypothetical protein BJ085DRAFT_35624 [Dimargaris cristalligena]|eukprot:RKP37710.1 hypothetical protein BJ085DRAFT_35624 [Dimargaris cristalligena]